MKNIEIKAKYLDLETGRKIAEAIGAKYIGCDHQIDTYFKTPAGRFKLRESSISGAYLVPYVRDNQKNAKASHYVIIPVVNAGEIKNIFSQILGVDSVVEKKRYIYLDDNLRIHLDNVKGIGTFFELEAVCDNNSDVNMETKKVNELLGLFHIKNEDLLSGSYREMSEGNC